MFDFSKTEKSLVFSLANLAIISKYKIKFNKNEILFSADRIVTKFLKDVDFKILKADNKIDSPVIENATILFYNIPDESLDKLKSMFLNNVTVLESNNEGEVFLNENNNSKIYINGFLVATEKNFLFSYNIKKPTKTIIKKIEKLELPFKRTAYVHKIKTILLNCEKAEIAMYLAKDLEKLDGGQAHDEINWKDVQLHAVKLLNALNKYLFITKSDYVKYYYLIDTAIESGYKPVYISQNIKDIVESEKDFLGKNINTINVFLEKYSKNFEFAYINKDQLTDVEKENLKIVENLLKDLAVELEIKISTNMLETKNKKYHVKNRTLVLKKEILSNIDTTLENAIEGIGRILYPEVDANRAILNLFVKFLKDKQNKFTHVSKINQKESIINKFLNKFKKKDGEKDVR
ncbi:hypothetical protein BG95_08125 [Thermosipho sp. 1063]|uniref:hypothetical protein n=1 Tax=unclassified Thermosipho (in: thermotogales) TaxID=2676525 RepID=UPI0009492D22|nr:MULTISPECIES: hypothetical protein [unclassified Thermosipho (in: thermotogales)]ANQ54373.1 hypothetical protein Y592_08210 [Thermosipho sp. 1070]APT72818.1 hypothetical protein BG95_08125 [Thermosipho sp. 1063]OOC42252.1 hypothetical protein XO08_08230 [Thermosipho sp. 1074]